MITTTDKLILANAVNIFGIEKEANITAYISSRTPFLDIRTWKKIYSEIEKESKDNGYSSVVEYCEDQRFRKLIELYKLKIKERDEILNKTYKEENYCITNENSGSLYVIGEKEFNSEKMFRKNTMERKNFDFIIPSSEAAKDHIETVLSAVQEMKQPYSNEWCKFTTVALEEERLSKLESFSEIKKENVYSNEALVETKEFKNYMNEEINEEQNINNSPLDSLKDSKLNKRYYIKMTDEERELDDFMDKIDEDYFLTNKNVDRIIKNDFKEKFPPLCYSYQNESIKNKGVIVEDTIIPKISEVKKKEIVPIKENLNITQDTKRKSENEEIKKVKRPVTLDEQYDEIIEKIFGNRRVEKDKNNWFNEFKILLKVFLHKIDERNEPELSNIKILIKDLLSELYKESNLTNCILNIMFSLQEVIFDTQSDELFNLTAMFKNVVYSFYDFYRK